MAIDNFIPSVWASRLLVNLYNEHVYGAPGVVNRDYQGDIANKGDSVRITAIGPVTVNDYVKNSTIAAPETLDDAQTVLLIEKQKYFNFAIDDVDAVQQTPKVMDDAMRESAYALSDASDTYIAGVMVAGVSVANLIGSEASPKTDLGTPANAYNYLVDLGVLLDEAKVPKAMRFVVVPPWFHGVLQKADLFVHATAVGDAVIRNGVVGTAAGFTIRLSNNVPKTTATTKFKIIAGTSMATTYAEQVNKIEAFRPPDRFADALKGLHLYGAKVIRPSGLAMLIANKP